MRNTGIRGLAALLLPVMLVIAAGCGSSSKTSTAPNTPEQRKVDLALAKQALLKLSDLPPGYKGAPHSNSSNGDIPPRVIQKFVACTHLPKRFVDDKSDDQPKADAPDFTSGNIRTGAATEIDSSVEIDRSSKDISEPLGLLANGNTAHCFQPFFDAALAQGLKGAPGFSIQRVTVKSIPAGSAGDQGAGFQGQMTLGTPVGSMVVYLDFLLVRTGRAAINLTGIGFREPVALDLEHELLATIVGRLKNTT